MKSFVLEETNWKNVEHSQYEVALLPWAATEAHNYHLPYSTDSIIAQNVAVKAAEIAHEKGFKIMVLPTIPFGVNTGQSDIPFDLNINPSTQMMILDDLIYGLNKNGIKKLILINTHGGNDFKQMLRELGLKYPDMLLLTCNWFKALDRKKYFENDGDHADELETSVIMYLKPECMLPLHEAGSGKAKGSKINAIKEGWAWMERRWTQVTNDTGVGNPSKATSLKGERAFNESVEKIAQLICEFAEIKAHELYEES